MSQAAGRLSFRPPRNNRLMIAVARRLVAPLVLRWARDVREVRVAPASLARLQELRSQRVVLCPNHPGWEDGTLMFYLSGLVGKEFNFLAARETFSLPGRGCLMQRLGCYSIVRGTADRDAFRTTRRILAEGRRWLVLFPEGETYGQNDMVMPFRPGIAQLVFWALEDLDRQGGLAPIQLVPVAINYLYPREMAQVIDRALARIERRLGLGPAAAAARIAPGELYTRLLRAGDAVLSVAEKEYGARPTPGAAFGDRLAAFKEQIVARVARDLGVSLADDQPLIDRIRRLFLTMDQILAEEPAGSEYEQQVHRRRQESLRPLYVELRVVLRFVATYEGYVRETMTAERFLEVIRLLEFEVFGKSRRYGPTIARLEFGAPVDASAFWPQYRENKRATLGLVMHGLETAVQTLLAELMRDRHPVGALT